MNQSCYYLATFNPWSPGGTFMVQKMSSISPMPVFQELKSDANNYLYSYKKCFDAIHHHEFNSRPPPPPKKKYVCV